MASFPLNRWYKEVIKAEWQHFTAVKKTFNTASAIGNGRYVFDLGGNKYRLVAMIHFNRRTVYIRFIGNHKQCDEIIKSGIIKQYNTIFMKHIKTRGDYHLAMAEIETYLSKGFGKLTPKEDDELHELSIMASEHEKIHFPMPVIHDMATILEAYMKENNFTKQKFAAFLGVGNSTLSEILNKKRPISMAFAKKLHSKLHLDGNLILEMA